LLGTLCYAKPMKGYAGAERSEGELSRVTFSDKMLLKIVLIKIDGEYNKEYNASYFHSYNNGPKIDIQLLPGRHELEFEVRADNTSAKCTVKTMRYDFEAAKEYILNVDKGVLTVEEKAKGKNIPVNPEITDVAFYQGPEESAPHATLLDDGKSRTFVYRIDDIPGSEFNFHAFFNAKWDGVFQVTLSPGKHTITYYQGKPGDSPNVKEFMFEEGKRYEFVSFGEIAETEKELKVK